MGFFLFMAQLGGGAGAVEEFDDICIHDITANKPSVTSITANKPVAANISRVEC